MDIIMWNTAKSFAVYCDWGKAKQNKKKKRKDKMQTAFKQYSLYLFAWNFWRWMIF